MSATDSRGYTEYTATNPIMVTMIDYIPLSIGSYSFYRPEPTTGEIKLTYKGNYFNGSFGAQNNNLTVKYRYKEATSSTWNEYKSFTSTISGNTYSLTISLGTDFDYQKSYDFQLVVTDKIDSITKSQTVSRGIPALFMGQDRVEVNGILNVNGDTSISGTLTTNGAVNMNDTLTFYGKSFDAGGSVNLANGDIIRANSIYMSDESTGNEGINFLKQNGDRTVKTDYETLRGYRGKTYYVDKALAFEPVVLYNNATGTTGTVTLSETAVNFDYLEIFYFLNNVQTWVSCVKIHSPNTKYASLETSWVYNTTNGGIQTGVGNIYINGTKINKYRYGVCNVENGANIWSGSENVITITKVLGYR